MSNVNLRKDLELWVDFSERYWNPQTNRIQDQSGYGRHPEASGGPTLGAEGPNDFEAASFDGSDDYFHVPSGLTEVEGGFSVTVSFKSDPSNSGNDGYLFSSDNFDANSITLRIDGNDKLSIVYGDGNDKESTSGPTSVRDDKWHTATFVRYGDDYSIVLDGEVDLFGTNTSIDSTINDTSPDIGRKPTDTSYFLGEMALCVFHTRALSDAEIEELNRMTAPRRSNL